MVSVIFPEEEPQMPLDDIYEEVYDFFKISENERSPQIMPE